MCLTWSETPKDRFSHDVAHLYCDQTVSEVKEQSNDNLGLHSLPSPKQNKKRVKR